MSAVQRWSCWREGVSARTKSPYELASIRATVSCGGECYSSRPRLDFPGLVSARVANRRGFRQAGVVFQPRSRICRRVVPRRASQQSTPTDELMGGRSQEHACRPARSPNRARIRTRRARGGRALMPGLIGDVRTTPDIPSTDPPWVSTHSLRSPSRDDRPSSPASAAPCGPHPFRQRLRARPVHAGMGTTARCLEGLASASWMTDRSPGAAGHGGETRPASREALALIACGDRRRISILRGAHIAQ